jgi:protein-L-isoaspartate(D-aspartate) O-methyltransferase
MTNVDQAFKAVDRSDFVPAHLRSQVGVDAPLPIGFGQTISQPTTVKLMLEWLDAQPGDKVLDVGSGSGWTTALLAHLVGPKGQVYAVERIPELVEFGRENCRKYYVTNVQFSVADKMYGLPQWAPYDRILVSAASSGLPEELLAQIKKGGKLVIPLKNDILEITKVSATDYQTLVHPGFRFVPLI